VKCFAAYKECCVACEEKKCRLWIDHEEDLNCTLIAIDNNKSDSMTLREIGERMGVSFVRIKQIEEGALKKLEKMGFKTKEMA